MKKITLCLMLILALIIVPGAIFAAAGDVTEVADSTALVEAVKTSGTVKLVSDIDLDSRLLINPGVNVTLDLNGKTLDLPTNEEWNNYGITVKGELIITGNGTVNFNGWYGIGTSTAGGNVIVKNGTFNGKESDYMFGSFGGKIVLEDGTYNGNYCVINAFVEYTGTAEVKGGTFSNKETTVVLGNTKVSGGIFNQILENNYIASSAKLTYKLDKDVDLDERLLIDTGVSITLDLNGKTLELPTAEEWNNYGITVKGELIITGNGTVNFNGWYGIGTNTAGGNVVVKNGTFNGKESDYMFGSFGGKIVLEDGTYNGNYCVINAFVEYKGIAEVKGGTFNNIEEGTVVLGNTKVSGGTFYKFNPAAVELEEEKYNYVAQGYRVIKNEDWYTVCEIKDTEAEVSDKVVNAEKVEEMVLETLKETVASNSELAAAIEGKSIEIQVELKPVTINTSEKETIEKEAAKKVEDIKVAEYIDISILVKDADTDEELGKLSTVKEAIKFTVEVPSELKSDIPEGYTRIFYIIRNHNGVIEVLETKEAEGKLFFETDKFSTYAIAYKDVKEETVTPPVGEEETITPPAGESGEGEAVPEPEVQPEVKPTTPDVPKTGDNVVVFAVIAILAMVGIVTVVKMRKK